MRSRCYRLGILTLMTLFILSTAHAGPLHDATMKGNIDQVEGLIAKGADVNAKGSDGRTPLHIAAGNGHSHMVKLLKRHGAK